MLALFAPLVFLLAFSASMATILYMVDLYGARAMAALRREHVPAATIRNGPISYQPVREVRGNVTVRSARGALPPTRYAA